MKQKEIKIIESNMDSQANLMDARDALHVSKKHTDKALSHIDKAMESKRFANKLVKGAV